jgi:hypothetical protein
MSDDSYVKSEKESHVEDKMQEKKSVRKYQAERTLILNTEMPNCLENYMELIC